MKYQLEPQAYEKLRQVIKTNTSFENLTEDNIKLKKEAYRMLLSWLEEVYNIDRKPIELDQEGIDISKLFKNY